MEHSYQIGQSLRVRVSDLVEKIVFEDTSQESCPSIIISDHQFLKFIRQVRRFLRDPTNSENRHGVYLIDCVTVQFEVNKITLSNPLQIKIDITVLEMKLFFDSLFINRRVFFRRLEKEEQNVLNNLVVIMANIAGDLESFSSLKKHFDFYTEECKQAIRISFKSFGSEVSDEELVEAYFYIIIHINAVLLLIFAGRSVFLSIEALR